MKHLYPHQSVSSSRLKYLLICALFWCTMQVMYSQSVTSNTKELFSRPGLSVGSYHFNFFDGTYNSSIRYLGDTVLCGKTLLRYDFSAYSGIYNDVYHLIEGGKVSVFNPNTCNTVQDVFNFDLEVGDSFNIYLVKPLKVVEVDSFSLNNGERRKYIKLKAENNNGLPPTFFEWVEGIGDLQYGLRYTFYDFEGYEQMVCVKDSNSTLVENNTPIFVDCDSLTCPEPLPNFDFTINDDIAQFYNRSQDANLYHWDFGDGYTSNSKNPSHQYTVPGCYLVTLTIKTPCLQRVFVRTRTVPICIDPKWIPFDSPLPHQSVVLKFLDAEHGWCFSGNQVFATKNGGNFWTQINIPLPNLPVRRLITDLTMKDTLNGIITCGHYSGNGTEKAILVTHDGGASWTEHIEGSYWQFNGLMTNDGKAFSRGSYGEVFYSDNEGDTWVSHELPSLYDLQQWQYMGNDTLYGFGWYGLQPNVEYVFLISPDNGASWKIYDNFPTDQLPSDFYFINTKEGWLGGYYGGFWHTTDSGTTWESVDIGDNEVIYDIEFADATNGWAVGRNGLVLHTTDGGQNWQRENCGTAVLIHSLTVPTPTNAFLSGNSGLTQQYHPNPALDCTSSTVEIPTKTMNELHISPNPATEIVTVSVPYNTSHQMVLFNSMGQVEIETTILGGRAQLSVSGLTPGIYWLKLDNGQHGKLVVARE